MRLGYNVFIGCSYIQVIRKLIGMEKKQDPEMKWIELDNLRIMDMPVDDYRTQISSALGLPTEYFSRGDMKELLGLNEKPDPRIVSKLVIDNFASQHITYDAFAEAMEKNNLKAAIEISKLNDTLNKFGHGR